VDFKVVAAEEVNNMAQGFQFPNLRFRPTIGAANIAQLLIQKPVLEEEMRARREREKRAKFNQFLNTIGTAASVGQAVTGISAQRQAIKLRNQQQAAQRGLGESLAGQVPGALAPGVEGPLAPGVRPQQEALRQAAIVSPGRAGQAAIGNAFPELSARRGGAQGLSSLVSLSNNLANRRIFVEPGSEEDGALVKQQNALNRRISTLSGVEFVPTPFTSRADMDEAAFKAEKKKREEAKERGGVFGGIRRFLTGSSGVETTGAGVAVPRAPVLKPEAPAKRGPASPAEQRRGLQFRTKEDVKAAWQRGEITREQANRILRERFGGR